jgi:hypothetical protein
MGEGIRGVTGLSSWLEETWVPKGKEGDRSREKVEPKTGELRRAVTVALARVQGDTEGVLAYKSWRMSERVA